MKRLTLFAVPPALILAGCTTVVPDDTVSFQSTAPSVAITSEVLPTEPVGEPTFVGFSVASLGDASRGGLWLETPLVDAEGPGSVISEAGQVLAVQLIPLDAERGSGSRLSLQGFQALGIPLTDLPTLTVNAAGDA